MTCVFILVDALGWELVRGRDFLRDVLPYQMELRTVFGYSSAAIPSILTGLLPDGHGHWNLFYYSPETSPFRWARLLRVLPKPLRENRLARKAVAVIGRKLSGTDGYFQIYGIPVSLLPYFDICEKNNIYRPGGLGPVKSIFDLLKENGIPAKIYTYHNYSDWGALERAGLDIRQRAASVYFIYLSELDAFLHHHVADAAAVNVELDRYARAIRQVFDAAVAVDPEAPFYVFSDHGMTPIRETCDVMGAVRSLGWKEPVDYLALYDATMARFWFFRDEARHGITERLASLSCGTILSREEQVRLGIGFDDRRFGELIFAMKPGCLIHPSYMGRVPWAGMHGFHPDDPHSPAALLARRQPPIPVRSTCDLFALMRREAGLL